MQATEDRFGYSMIIFWNRALIDISRRVGRGYNKEDVLSFYKRERDTSTSELHLRWGKNLRLQRL